MKLKEERKRGDRKKSICDVAFAKMKAKFFTHLRQAQKKGRITEKVVRDFDINFYDILTLVEKAFADSGFVIREDFLWNSMRYDDRFDYRKKGAMTFLFPAQATELAATYNVHSLPTKKRIVPMKKAVAASR